MYKYCDVICRIESPPLLCTCGTTTISLVKSYLVRDKQKSSLTQTPLWLLHIETIAPAEGPKLITAQGWLSCTERIYYRRSMSSRQAPRGLVCYVECTVVLYTIKTVITPVLASTRHFFVLLGRHLGRQLSTGGDTGGPCLKITFSVFFYIPILKVNSCLTNCIQLCVIISSP